MQQRNKSLRPFIQPAIGINIDWLELAFSTRMAFVDYTQVKTSEPDDERLSDFLKSKTWVFIEPALTLRAGYKNVKIHAQYVLSDNLSDPDGEWWVDETFSIGLSLDFAKRFSQKKQDRKF